MIPIVTTKLPALSVYDNPVVAISDTIWGGREPNDLFDLGYGITLHRPDDPAFDRVSDIVLSYRSSFVCANVSVYRPRDSVWVQIDAPWDGIQCNRTWGTDWTSE